MEDDTFVSIIIVVAAIVGAIVAVFVVLGLVGVIEYLNLLDAAA